MASTAESNVVMLAYSVPRVARIMGCSQQMILDSISDDEMPAHLVDGKYRVPRGYLTNFPWSDAPCFA